MNQRELDIWNRAFRKAVIYLNDDLITMFFWHGTFTSLDVDIETINNAYVSLIEMEP